MTPTFAETSGDEVYVFVRGRLVMKRWLKTNVSALYHLAPNGVSWRTSLLCGPAGLGEK